MRYEHTQTAPLYIILAASCAGMLVAAWTIPVLPLRIMFCVIGGLMVLLTLSFRQLTVSDQRDHLLVQFGPLPLFRRRVKYADIGSVQRSRTSFLDGWGIHISPSGGWTWNLWGFDCVDVHFKKGWRLRIGTDDPDGLEAFLQETLGVERPIDK